jgi:carbamoyltransferase
MRKIGRCAREFSPGGGGEAVGGEGSWLELFRVDKLLRRNFGAFGAKVHYLDHHRCHIASAFHVSPFEDATILVFDGAGEEISTTLAAGSGTEVKVLREIAWPHSLGHFYAAMTGFLGFKMLDGEYKMMGLAPYNSPDYLDFLRSQVLTTDAPGSFRLNSRLLDYHDALDNRFSPGLVEALGPARRDDDEPFTERHQKIAASTQAAFEEVVLDLARWAFENGGGKTNLAIAGGCGLNCTANGRLLREGPFERIFVPPAPHDAGCAVGAAFHLWHDVLGKPRDFVMEHAYYGPEFTNSEMAKALAMRGIHAQSLPNEDSLIERAADTLADGKIICWFQGRTEFGPRALGNRSFLADPRNDSIRDQINAKIKKRELFRPFAPSVKKERVSDYFCTEQASPFMNIIAQVREDKHKDIPAVTHVDGTARFHTVSREANPRYWKLLDRFENITGVPVLLNTSFNIQEPIVCTPTEAVDCYMRSSVDVLVMGDYFITRDMFPA